MKESRDVTIEDRAHCQYTNNSSPASGLRTKEWLRRNLSKDEFQLFHTQADMFVFIDSSNSLLKGIPSHARGDTCDSVVEQWYPFSIELPSEHDIRLNHGLSTERNNGGTPIACASEGSSVITPVKRHTKTILTDRHEKCPSPGINMGCSAEKDRVLSISPSVGDHVSNISISRCPSNTTVHLEIVYNDNSNSCISVDSCADGEGDVMKENMGHAPHMLCGRNAKDILPPLVAAPNSPPPKDPSVMRSGSNQQQLPPKSPSTNNHRYSKQTRFFVALTDKGLRSYLRCVPIGQQHLYEIMRGCCDGEAADKKYQCKMYLDMERKGDYTPYSRLNTCDPPADGSFTPLYDNINYNTAYAIHSSHHHATCPYHCPVTPNNDPTFVSKVLTIYLLKFFELRRPELNLHIYPLMKVIASNGRDSDGDGTGVFEVDGFLDPLVSLNIRPDVIIEEAAELMINDGICEILQSVPKEYIDPSNYRYRLPRTAKRREDAHGDPIRSQCNAHSDEYTSYYIPTAEQKFSLHVIFNLLIPDKCIPSEIMDHNCDGDAIDHNIGLKRDRENEDNIATCSTQPFYGDDMCKRKDENKTPSFRKVTFGSNADVGKLVHEFVAFLYETLHQYHVEYFRHFHLIDEEIWSYSPVTGESRTCSDAAYHAYVELHSALFHHDVGTPGIHNAAIPPLTNTSNRSADTVAQRRPALHLKCIIDTAVYSRNRMFRCLGSCKLGKEEVLAHLPLPLPFKYLHHRSHSQQLCTSSYGLCQDSPISVYNSNPAALDNVENFFRSLIQQRETTVIKENQTITNRSIEEDIAVDIWSGTSGVDMMYVDGLLPLGCFSGLNTDYTVSLKKCSNPSERVPIRNNGNKYITVPNMHLPFHVIRLLKEGQTLAQATHQRRQGHANTLNPSHHLSPNNNMNYVSPLQTSKLLMEARGPTPIPSLNTFIAATCMPPSYTPRYTPALRGANDSHIPSEAVVFGKYSVVFKEIPSLQDHSALPQNSNMSHISSITVVLTSPKYCRKVKRCHKSNSVYYVFDVIYDHHHPASNSVIHELENNKDNIEWNNIPAANSAVKGNSSSNDCVHGVWGAGALPQSTVTSSGYAMRCTQRCFDPDCNMSIDGVTPKRYRSEDIIVSKNVQDDIWRWARNVHHPNC